MGVEVVNIFKIRILNTSNTVQREKLIKTVVEVKQWLITYFMILMINQLGYFMKAAFHKITKNFCTGITY